MPLIKCPRCGRQISNKAVQCPECGLQFGPAPGTFSKDSLLHPVPYICPECGSPNITCETIKEPIPFDIGTVIVYILLALTCCGLLVVIPILLQPKERLTTYATCSSCGYHWNMSEHNIITHGKNLQSREKQKEGLLIGILSITISLIVIFVCILIYNS